MNIKDFDNNAKLEKERVKSLKFKVIYLSVGILSSFSLVVILLFLNYYVINYKPVQEKVNHQKYPKRVEYRHSFLEHDSSNPLASMGIGDEDDDDVFDLSYGGKTIFEVLVDVWCCPYAEEDEEVFEASNLKSDDCKFHEQRTYFWPSEQLEDVKSELIEDLLVQRQEKNLLESIMLCPQGYDDLVFEFKEAKETELPMISYDCFGRCTSNTIESFRVANERLIIPPSFRTEVVFDEEGRTVSENRMEDIDLEFNPVSEFEIEELFFENTMKCSDYSTRSMILDNEGNVKSQDDAIWKMNEILRFFCGNVLKVRKDEVSEDKFSFFCVPEEETVCNFKLPF